MCQRWVTPGAVRFAAIVLLAVTGAAQTGKLAEARRIYVVAVHDSSLFTLLPADRQQMPLPEIMKLLPLQSFPEGFGILDRVRPDWQLLARTGPGICPSGRLDPDLKDKILKEFRGRREYALAGSAEEAELVFLAEGIYRSFHAYATSRVRGVQTVHFSVNSGDAGFGKRILQAALAVVVPSEVFMRHPADGEALLAAQLWQGAVVWREKSGSVPPVASASPGTLAEQFIARESAASRDLFPVSAAWSSGPAMRAGAGVPAAPGLKPDKTDGPPPEARGRPQRNPAAITVDVTFVTVPTVASDLAGNRVLDLRDRDFRLQEDGRAQKIDRVIPQAEPFYVALLLDSSNSTTLKHTDIQMAALGFGDALRSEDRLMAVSFGSAIRVHSEFTDERESFRRAILETKVEGGTRLYDAVDLVLSDRFHAIAGRKAIVLFTDGVDTSSRLADAASTLARIEESDVVVYVIQYDTRKDPGFGSFPKSAYDAGGRYLRDLSEHSGGLLFKASTVSSLTEAFRQIAEELRHQYTICYYPLNQANDGSYRRIRVTANQPGIRIRARPGYRIRN